MVLSEIYSKKSFLPFSDLGSVLHFHPIDSSFFLQSEISEREIQDLTSKPDARILFLNTPNFLELFPNFQRLGFEPSALSIPSFPTRQNFSQNDNFLEYATTLTNFIKQINKREVLIYFPEQNYLDVIQFVICAFLLRDETIRIDELLEYFFDDLSNISINIRELEDMKNYLYGEFYLTYLSNKIKPIVSFKVERKLQIDNEPLPKIEKEYVPEIRVKLLSTENNIPYELNLSSLSRKFPDTVAEEELHFNTSSLVPEEFVSESGQNSELLEDLLDMAENFDEENWELDDEVLSLDEIEDARENEPEAEFIQIKKIPNTPAIVSSEDELLDLDKEYPQETAISEISQEIELTHTTPTIEEPELILTPELHEPSIQTQIISEQKPSPIQVETTVKEKVEPPRLEKVVKVNFLPADWDSMLSIDIPEPVIHSESFITESGKVSKTEGLDPIFSGDFVPGISKKPKETPTKTIKRNFLGLPENW